MKNLLIVAFFVCAALFTSCSADQKTVDAMADDMCKMMEKYNPDDITTILNITTEMIDLKNKEGYDKVSETQLMDAMKTKCPDGEKKLQSIIDMGK
jgi:hypothetical protein